MVHHHHEHGRAIPPPTPTPLQRQLAANHLGHLLRAQPRPLRRLQHHHGAAVPAVSETVAGGASTSAPESVPGHVPRRAGDAGQHDGRGVRARMGSRDGHAGLGAVVDRQSAGVDDLLSFDVCDVSSHFVFLKFRMNNILPQNKSLTPRTTECHTRDASSRR